MNNNSIIVPGSLILITGGAGFIGSHTCDALLERGYRVRIMDLLDPQVHGPGRKLPAWIDRRVEFMRGDVRNRDDLSRAIAGVDAIYHFAAQTGVGQSMYEIHGYCDVNVGGTAMLLDVLANSDHRVAKIVLSSSRAVYGEGAYSCPACGPVFPPLRGREALEKSEWRIFCPSCGAPLESLPTAEGKPLAPISVYAETKRVQEELLRIFSATYGIPGVVLRYFNVYGTRQALGNPYTGIGAIFVTRRLSGSPISIYEDGLQGRDFVNVRDVVRANLLALTHETSGSETFNVGSGERLTVLDLARHVCRELGATEEFLYQGQFRVGDIRDCFADLGKSRSGLGYEPAVPFAAGVAELVSWARGEQRDDRLEEAESALRLHNLM
ncbi:dTDP-L-rhamnose 4-epimerase [Geobacter sp. OR-1]|uniref:SDR family NAD(P)-dependent oxidoreductase n=1 Tax=Geobacter sp. OR-1 TaxID=1266765 RepID=UPI000543033A|nr:SDR family NAD(P)-dependent oxidoreductase [Geobacter sp. OR-1]GAM08935.1 dTDP-L-rhamnose 4-epimerase [Geobacter sp. OR-1]